MSVILVSIFAFCLVVGVMTLAARAGVLPFLGFLACIAIAFFTTNFLRKVLVPNLFEDFSRAPVATAILWLVEGGFALFFITLALACLGLVVAADPLGKLTGKRKVYFED